MFKYACSFGKIMMNADKREKDYYDRRIMAEAITGEIVRGLENLAKIGSDIADAEKAREMQKMAAALLNNLLPEQEAAVSAGLQMPEKEIAASMSHSLSKQETAAASQNSLFGTLQEYIHEKERLCGRALAERTNYFYNIIKQKCSSSLANCVSDKEEIFDEFLLSGYFEQWYKAIIGSKKQAASTPEKTAGRAMHAELPKKSGNNSRTANFVVYHESPATDKECTTKPLYDCFKEAIQAKESDFDEKGLALRTKAFIKMVKEIFPLNYIRLANSGEVLHIDKSRKSSSLLIEADARKIMIHDLALFQDFFENWYGQLCVARNQNISRDNQISIFSLANEVFSDMASARKLHKSYYAQYINARLPDHLYLGGRGVLCTTDAEKARIELERLRNRKMIESEAAAS